MDKRLWSEVAARLQYLNPNMKKADINLIAKNWCVWGLSRRYGNTSDIDGLKNIFEKAQ